MKEKILAACIIFLLMIGVALFPMIFLAAPGNMTFSSARATPVVEPFAVPTLPRGYDLIVKRDGDFMDVILYIPSSTAEADDAAAIRQVREFVERTKLRARVTLCAQALPDDGAAKCEVYFQPPPRTGGLTRGDSEAK